MNRSLSQMAWRTLVAGSVGALVMMPAGFVFKALDMRVGHYGPKFAALYLSDPGPLALFVQHMVLGWISALPLCAVWLMRRTSAQALLLGAQYGVGYYVAINSFALPWIFGDPLPWTLGWQVVMPSLVVHVVYGVATAATARWMAMRSDCPSACPADGS